MVKCEQCGRANEDFYRFCLACGKPITAKAQGTASRAKPTAAAKAGLGDTEDEEAWFRSDERSASGARSAAGVAVGAGARAKTEPIRDIMDSGATVVDSADRTEIIDEGTETAPGQMQADRGRGGVAGAARVSSGRDEANDEHTEAGPVRLERGASAHDRSPGGAPFEHVSSAHNRPSTGHVRDRTPSGHARDRGESASPRDAAAGGGTVERAAPARSTAAHDVSSMATDPTPDAQPRVPVASSAAAPIPTSPGLAAVRSDSVGPPGTRACTGCGAELPPSFQFCGRCGTRVGEAVNANTLFLETEAGNAPEPRFMGRLVFIRPDGSTADTLPLSEADTLLGRSIGGRFNADRLLSPKHARFFFRNGRLHVRDESSLNGVYVRVRGERELDSGEVFRIGQQLLCFEDAGSLEVVQSVPEDEDTYLLGSPDLGYWGRLRQLVASNVTGNIFLLSGPEVTLGRERAHVTFPYDGFVSATHASLTRRGDKTVLSDRGSSNGTYVKLTSEAALTHGDVLLVGQQLLRVELQR